MRLARLLAAGRAFAVQAETSGLPRARLHNPVLLAMLALKGFPLGLYAIRPLNKVVAAGPANRISGLQSYSSQCAVTLDKPA